jgi:hypothetical protein
MFHGRAFQIRDETDTMGIKSWSRENVHVLTSIDYAKMSPEDKALESNPRADHDYGLSWIRREGQGRVFYEAHGTASVSMRCVRCSSTSLRGSSTRSVI